MNIITIDFETFYSTEFSLSKITTEEYVRSPEFEVIGVSVQVDDAEPVWFSGGMLETEHFLKQYDWANSFVLAHNAMFDGAIMSWLFGINPKGWLDTMSMARALHGTEVGGSLGALVQHYGVGVKGTEVNDAKGFRRADFTPEHLASYGEYCRNDVALTYKLFNCMVDKFPLSELRLIDLTLRMFIDPVLELDEAVLTKHLDEVKAKKEALLEKAASNRDVLMSNPKFADLLRLYGVEPPMKVSPTTGKQTYAFAKNDEAFKELADHPDPEVQALVAARLGTKSTLEETRTERFIGISQRGKLPVPLRYYAAHTGRWGGDDKLNLQNLPRLSPLKKAIVAPAGRVIIDSDSSQIEARTLAWLANQDDLVEAFDRGEDVYKIMASAIYSKPMDKITKDERFVGKTTILGAGYGMGAAKFRAQLKNFGVVIEEDEAKHIIDTYRRTYPKIQELWKTANGILDAVVSDQYAVLGRDDILKVEGVKGILLPNGLHIKYPNLRLQDVEHDGETKRQYAYDAKKGKATIPNHIYGGKVVENVCQALARIVIGEQMLLINKRYRPVMTVHDAIACVVPESEADIGMSYVETCMRTRPKWAPDLPLNCEAGYGKSYGDC
jgi:DNA polymerase I-like protein with 3'-5' exonuclease and polymerase domains